MHVPVVYLKRVYYSPYHIFWDRVSRRLTICFEWLGSKLLKSCCFLPSVRSQAWTAILGFWLGAQGPDLDLHAWIANTLPTEPSHQVNQHCQILMPIIQMRKLRFHTWLYPQVAEWLEKVTHHLRFEILYSCVRIASKHPEPPTLNEKQGWYKMACGALSQPW